MDNATDSSDEDLVRVTVETGEPAHFDPLVSRHTPKIRSLIVLMISNEAEANDLVQETFVRAYRKLASFNNRSSFSTWLHSIAINAVRDYQRRTVRNPVDAVEDPPPYATVRYASPDARAAHRELNEAIQEALDTLSPKLKTAIVCHVIEGISVAAIADIEGCSQATIYWRIHSARKKLRKMLSDHL